MSKPLTVLTGIAAPLPLENVDTDAIIPSRETQSTSRDGYGEKLFANWRYQPGTRVEDPDFVLNRPPYREAVMLVAGRNFGCGSSREAATWSLAQFGIRCVIAESFGTIFRNNCVRNGVAPVVLDEFAIARLTRAAEHPEAGFITVSLETCIVAAPDGESWRFELPERDRQMLLSGMDEIALTLTSLPQIEAFRAQDRVKRPWVYLV